MTNLRPISFFGMCLVASFSSASAQTTTRENAADSGSIVVVGNRAEQAEVAADQATVITMRPSDDFPLARRYAPICVKLVGIDPAYGDLIAERIRQNVKALGRPVGGARCQANVWIGFFQNSRDAVDRLRKDEPTFFETLKSFEIERIFTGSGAAQVWHATEIRSADGRPIPIAALNIPGVGGRKIETGYNAQYSGGRLTSPVRNDINGTIVIFDRDKANGKTVQQLADYATFRILAPVQDFAEVPAGAMPSILHLFAAGAELPDGLTEFDWAYLSAFYKLDRGAKVDAVHDGTKRSLLDGTGQKLLEKSAKD